MDKYQIVRFTYSPQTEAERIIHTSIVTSQGFYTLHGFVVLPRILKKRSAQAIILPDLAYDKIERYWQRISSINAQLPIKIPPDIKQSLLNNLTDSPQMRDLSKKRQMEWNSRSENFFKLLWQIVPERAKLARFITVRLTEYGSISSYSYLTNKKNQHLICYVRSDASLAHVAEAILTALLYPKLGKQYYSWRERESIVDFLLESKIFRSLFPDYAPTLSAVKLTDKQLMGISNKYLENLGFKTFEKTISIKDGAIFFKNKPISSELTSKQRTIIQALASSPDMTLTYDQIADSAWGVDRFPTLWTITKTMQRTRNILLRLTANSHTIAPIRGYGYKLKEK